MKFILNNRPETITGIKEISVEELLKVKNFTFPMIIVKINGVLVKKQNYPFLKIKDGDVVSAVHLISGG